MATTFDANLQQKNEDKVSTMIEERTSKVPSVAYLGLAVGSMVASAALMLSGKKQLANFIGQWAPSFLLFGIYNKLVKQLGSDRTENAV